MVIYYFDTDIVLLASMEKRIHPQATFVTVRAVERYGGGLRAFHVCHCLVRDRMLQ